MPSPAKPVPIVHPQGDRLRNDERGVGRDRRQVLRVHTAKPKAKPARSATDGERVRQIENDLSRSNPDRILVYEELRWVDAETNQGSVIRVGRHRETRTNKHISVGADLKHTGVDGEPGLLVCARRLLDEIGRSSYRLRYKIGGVEWRTREGPWVAICSIHRSPAPSI